MQPFRDMSIEYRSSLVAKYSRKPLPEPPLHLYFTPSSSTSFDSLLTHEIPAPFLYQNEEMSEVLSRISSSYADLRPDSCLTTLYRGSLQTVTERSEPVYQQQTPRPQSLLPPPPEFLRTWARVGVVECRLSSTSTQLTVAQQSPWQLSKRSVTPSLLTKLSSEIVELTASHELPDPSPLSPNTPPSLCCSYSSIATPEDPPSPSDSNELQYHDTFSCEAMEFTSRSGLREAAYPKPGRISTETSFRNISPPMPTPLHNGLRATLKLPMHAASDVDLTYQPFRPVPDAPGHLKTKEVSCIEWDDDGEKSRLTRMKKSFTDLRTAGTGKLRPDSDSRKQHKAQRRLQFVEPHVADAKVDLNSNQQTTKKTFATTEVNLTATRSLVPLPLSFSRTVSANHNSSTHMSANASTQAITNSSGQRITKGHKNADVRGFPSVTRKRAVSESAAVDPTPTPRTARALSMPAQGPPPTSNTFGTTGMGRRGSSGKSTITSFSSTAKSPKGSKERSSLASPKSWWAGWMFGCSASSRKVVSEPR